MEYQQSLPIEQELALDAATAAFTAAGLTAHARTASTIALTCTPRLWNLQLHPLRGIAEAEVSVVANRLSIRADLGNIARFGRFVSIMLAVIDLAAIALLLRTRQNETPLALGLAVGLILILSAIAVPLEMLKQKRRATKAIDRLLARACKATELAIPRTTRTMNRQP